MHKFYTLLIFFGLVAFTACENPHNEFIIKGHIDNYKSNKKIILEKRGVNDVEDIDSAMPDSLGNFILKGSYLEPMLYTITINNISLPLIIDNTSLSLQIDWNHPDNFKLSHSEGAQKLSSFLSQYKNKKLEWFAIKMVMDSLIANNANDSFKLSVQRRGDDINDQITHCIENFIDTVQSVPLIYYVASVYLDPYDDAAYFKKLATTLPNRFKKSSLAKDFSLLINSKQKMMEISSASVKEGDSSIDFSIPDTNDNLVSLSSYKGKYVLLTFWASWCPPCRGDNVYLLAAYHQFKNDSFDILSVSLDYTKADWLKAIKQDKLEWTNVCDLKKWQSIPVTKYNVRSIPSNYLIDPQGIIIAKDLRSDDLINYLNQKFKKKDTTIVSNP